MRRFFLLVEGFSCNFEGIGELWRVLSRRVVWFCDWLLAGVD